MNNLPSTNHLNDTTAKLLLLSKAERIERIQSPRWIGYPRAQEVIGKLEDLLVYPKTHRMPNLLIVGETNNGKTMLVNRFKKKHPAIDNPCGDGIVVPVLLIQAPPVPDEGRFYNTILEALFAPYKTNDRVDKKQFQAIKLLRYVGLKILVIDEIHHILAGNMNKQRAFLNVIKYLGNELQIPIVGLGTKDAFRAIQTDPQLANRFESALLPAWKMDETFLRLLISFERMLPLMNESGLHDVSLATKIYSMSEGCLGEISTLLTQAAVRAVKTGKERIDAKLLDSLNWVSPSNRKRQIDRISG
jgi:type II secretory pathway predicted ATPase ExeA